MDHKAFDDIVGEKLNETQSFPFDEAQWRAVESQLDQKKKKRLFVWWYWGAAAAAVILIGFAYNSILLHQKINALEHQVEQLDQIEQKPQEIPLKEATEQITTISTNTPKTNSNSTASTQSNQVKKSPAKPSKTYPKFHALEASPIIPNSKPKSILSVVEKIVENKTLKPEKESPEVIPSENKIADLNTNSVDHNLSALATLDLKETVLKAKSYKTPELAITKTKLKNKFGFQTFSTGFSANAGWGIVNVLSNLSLLNHRTADSAISTSNYTNYQYNKNDQKTSSSSLNISNIRWWNQFHFSKGFSIKTELGRKRINFDVQSNNNSAAFSPAESSLFDNLFSTTPSYSNVNSAQIIQTEWMLGAGLSYSPFKKWKVQPYLSLIPELSWNVVRKESFIVLDSSADESFSNEIPSTKLHLRSLSNRVGIQTVFGKHFLVQTEFGYNIPINIINASLLNRFQVGLNVGYKF